jgi:LacI family transcriptional regulator
MPSPRGPSRPTIETISEAAGVSVSTVSRALKGNRRISERTRTAVVEIARQLGYLPNAHARSLVTRRSGLIGFVMGDVYNPFYPEMLESLVQRATARNLRLMVLHVGREPLAMSTIESLLQYQMDGCIITSAELTSKAAEVCRAHRLPMVAMNRIPRLNSCAVSCNNEAGGRVLGELLVAAGHRKIAIVAGTPNTSTSGNREAGVITTLSKAGMKPHARLEGGSTYEGGLAAGRALANARRRPDAVFAVNDIMALGVMDALRANGLRVPEDISVVGFDDIHAASWSNYDLTTVSQPIDAMVERALDLLDARMKEPDAPGENAFIVGALRIRTSARLPVDLPTTMENLQKRGLI